MISNYLIDLVVAIGIGLTIGLEREFKESIEKDHFAGIRTYPLISILGFVTTILSQHLTSGIFLAALPAIVLLIGVAYYSRTMKGHVGLSSEIALLITFLLGSLSALHLIREALSVAVMTTVLLALKGTAKTFISHITQQEIFAFIKFAVLTMLVLPFLPDQDMRPNGLLNPFDIGVVVIVISSLSFVGYLLTKFIGSEKGILLAALFGGIISSTSVAWVFASRSKDADNRHGTLYAGGIVLASTIMFLRVGIVTLIFNFNLFLHIIVPCLLMTITGLVSLWIMRRQLPKVEPQQELAIGNPLEIFNALLFGALFTGISLMVYYADSFFGDKGLVVSGVISGLVDVDAITISLAKHSSGEKLNIAVLVIVAAMLTNSIFKYGIILAKGSTLLKKKTIGPFGAMILAGLAYTAFQLILN